MAHGILSSADNFLMNGKDQSPAYILANTGLYDVWLMNVRGNRYSRSHSFLEPNSATEFWNFSFEEMGNHDLPACVDYILGATGKKQLTMIGFSQGTTVMFHSLALNNVFYQGKIKKFIGLAPVSTMKYSQEKLLSTLASSFILEYYLISGNYLEAFSAVGTQASTFSALGAICTLFQFICLNTITMLATVRTDLVN